jgi:(E)-4-hydroxy-3-methyl-but-2-enyl pyrophosphate reductase
MKIYIDDKAGFCPGVLKAINIVEERLSSGKSVNALGSLIHNQNELDRLKKMGLKEVNQELVETNDVDWDQIKKDVLLIRSHGVSPKLLEQIEARKIAYIDGTCSRVIRSQKLIRQYFNDGYEIVIVGKANHPEVKALMGYCDNKGIVVLQPGDEKNIKHKKKLLLIAQTTIDEDTFEYFAKRLTKGVDNLVVKNTICSVIQNRHEQVIKLARENDVVIFVAGENSSNSQVLFEISRKQNPKSYFISSADELKFEWFESARTVGITGGASTPYWQLNEVKTIIHNKH